MNGILGNMVSAPASRICLAFALCLFGCGEEHGGPPAQPEPPDTGPYTLGSFELERDDTGTLRVRHASEPDHVVFELSGRFAELWAVTDTIREGSGSFRITEKVGARCNEQSAATLTVSAEAVMLTSELRCDGESVSVALSFAPESERALGFRMTASVPEGAKLNQLVLVLPTTTEERFVGFGEQFSHVNLRGKVMPILVQEGGIGRAEGTVADLLEELVPGTGGTFYSTYAPMPFTFTDRGRSLLLENEELSWFDLRAEDRVRVRLRGLSMRGRILAGKAPRDILASLTEFTGRMPVLPDWMGEGAIIGMQGGTQRVREVLAGLEAAKVPVAGFWLQDWVGKRATPFGSRLWWNWQLNPQQYPEFETLSAELRDKGIRVMTYINPYVVDIAQEDAPPAGAFTRNLYVEARDAGYLVKNAEGAPYEHISGTFAAGIVDLTNAAAVDWYKDVLREELLGLDVSGYMADFGEALPFDAVLANGLAEREHNLWPERWTELNREVLEELGLLGEVAFFTRSGYLRTAGSSTLFWAGDQMQTWDEHDGMASGLTGLLSGGLSGMTLNHTDVGGYTAYDTARRNEELLLRWIEWSAFTAVFRSHEGNRPEVPQLYEGERALAHLHKFTRLFVALAPYRKGLMKEASERGLPLVRHLLLEYPDDPRAWDEAREFMLGSDVLVAPAFAPDTTTVRVYLPEGTWVPLFGGDTREGPMQLDVPSPLGEPAVFYRAGSSAGEALQAALVP